MVDERTEVYRTMEVEAKRVAMARVHAYVKRSAAFEAGGEADAVMVTQIDPRGKWRELRKS